MNQQLRSLFCRSLAMALLFVTSTSFADDIDDALEKVKQAKAEVQAIQIETMKGYSPDLTPQEQQAFMVKSMEIQAEQIAPILVDTLEILKPYAEDERVMDGLSWIINNDPGSEIGIAAAEIMMEHHVIHPVTLQTASRFQYAPMSWTVPMLEKIIATTGDEYQKMEASLALAQALKTLSTFPDLIENLSDENRAMIEMRYGKEYLEQMTSANTKELETRAVALYRKLGDEYGDKEVYGRSVKEMVDSAIFEIEHLSIGKVAPEIEGEDIDGVAFKLSDYRGKVVMLDFWGDW